MSPADAITCREGTTLAVHVLLPLVPGSGVVRKHRIQVARRDTDEQARRAHGPDGLAVPPVRLGDDAHTIALRLQHAPDERRAKRRVVHVGVTRDDEHIQFVPAARRHLGARHGEKRRGVRRSVLSCGGHDPEDASSALVKQLGVDSSATRFRNSHVRGHWNDGSKWTTRLASRSSVA